MDIMHPSVHSWLQEADAALAVLRLGFPVCMVVIHSDRLNGLMVQEGQAVEFL